MTVTIDPERIPEASTLVVQVEKFQPDEKLAIRLTGDRKETKWNATWHPLVRKQMVTLFDQAVDLSLKSEHSFQLPANALTMNDLVSLKIGYYTARLPLRSGACKSRLRSYHSLD